MDMQPSEVSGGDIHERLESWLNSPEEPATEESADIAETGTQDQAQPETLEAEEPEGQAEAGGETDAESTVVEVDGEEFDLPKEVAEKVATVKKRMEADYTRKTQEAAELKRSAVAMQQTLQQQATFQQQNMADLVEYKTVVNQLKEYDKVDWAALAETDIIAFNKHREVRDQLRYQAQQMGDEFGQKFQHTQAQQVQAINQARKSCIETVQNAIPEYDSALDQKAVKAAERLAKKFKLPFDATVLSQSTDPLTWIGLTELAKYYDILDKSGNVKKQVAEAPKLSVKAKPQTQQSNRESKRRELLKAGRIREAAAL
jgi:hypothetical protein